MNIFPNIAQPMKWEGYMEKYRPGEVVPMSGDYEAHSDKGRDGGTVYLERGERFPATQHEGSYYCRAKD